MRRLVIVTLCLCLGLALAACGDEADSDSDRAEGTPSSSGPAVVPDEEWCAGWQAMVQLQGQYVASQSEQDAAALLVVVEQLQELGVPESLDPSGYTELTAVLDDVRASADPTFTPSVAPSEPADVAVEGQEHEGDEHEDHGAEAGEAPFGAWLAEYCAV
jgi:hypothetical protein